MNTYNSPFLSKGAWLTGALIGGGLAMLASPQTGTYVRNQLRTLAGNAGSEMAEAMGRRLTTALERGIDYAERGQVILRDASRAMDCAIERGKEYLESGKGRVSSMSRRNDMGWQSANGFATAGAVVAGILVGGGIALLMTPKTGAEVRRQLKGYAGRMGPYSDRAKGATAMVREK